MLMYVVMEDTSVARLQCATIQRDHMIVSVNSWNSGYHGNGKNCSRVSNKFISFRFCITLLA